uniref:7TM_GPCR_Srx domain-containing protein n=1 Tax=Heterorhabditis bacteriophora TaxID=37862 RepID=A0A1I7X5M5_HETBA
MTPSFNRDSKHFFACDSSLLSLTLNSIIGYLVNCFVHLFRYICIRRSTFFKHPQLFSFLISDKVFYIVFTGSFQLLSGFRLYLTGSFIEVLHHLL